MEFNFLFFYFLPTPGLTHSYSTFFCTECRRGEKKKNKDWKIKLLLLKKKRIVYKEKGTTELSAIQMLQKFFFLIFY